jgi:hypothetical protein
VNVTLSTPMLKMIDDLLKTGLWGASHEEVARQLIEVQLRELIRAAMHVEGDKEVRSETQADDL